MIDQLAKSRIQQPALDKAGIDLARLSTEGLMRELNLMERPSWVLCLLMNALEARRQKAGQGWSRPWNKVGMTIFRSHRLDLKNDVTTVGLVRELVHQLSQRLRPRFAEFNEALLSDPRCLGFVFYHVYDQGNSRYEGLTLSFGRKRTDDRGKRDRLDLILEDRVINQRVDGQLDRVRLLSCPWSTYSVGRVFGEAIEERESLSSEDELGGKVQALYESSVRDYQQWKREEDRQWDHWSQRYIDYFGARAFIPIGTSFS